MAVLAKPGRMRKRIEVQTATETIDSHGGGVPSWSTTTTRWAEVRPLSAREVLQARQANLMVTHEIRIRSYADLSSHQRFKLGSRVFNIGSILNSEERGVVNVCLCTEVT